MRTSPHPFSSWRYKIKQVPVSTAQAKSLSGQNLGRGEIGAGGEYYPMEGEPYFFKVHSVSSVLVNFCKIEPKSSPKVAAHRLHREWHIISYPFHSQLTNPFEATRIPEFKYSVLRATRKSDLLQRENRIWNKSMSLLPSDKDLGDILFHKVWFIMHIIAPHSAESWAEPISQSPLEMLTTEVPKPRG